MLHHPSGSARGQASDINNEARELMRLRNYVNQVLSQATGQPIEKVCTPFAFYCCTPSDHLVLQGACCTMFCPIRTPCWWCTQSSALIKVYAQVNVGAFLFLPCLDECYPIDLLVQCRSSLTSTGTSTLTPRRHRSTGSLTRLFGPCAPKLWASDDLVQLSHQGQEKS